MVRSRDGHRPTQKEKTLRAFRAYLDVLDTAAWLKSWMHGPLASFDLTMQGFRLLVLLYRDGPTPMTEAAKQMRFPRQNLEFVLRRLEKRGWVCRENVRARAARKKTRQERDMRRIGPKLGWQMTIIRLTPLGEKFVAQVFPRHAKVVKALMRALDGREQETLSEICRKLRAGHVIKFMSEITHPDAWDEAQYEDDGDGLSEPLQTPAESPEEASPPTLRAEDWERLNGIAEKMRSHDVVRNARNVHWNEVPDRERDARNAVEMLMRVTDNGERKVLERMRQTLADTDLIEILQQITVGGAQSYPDTKPSKISFRGFRDE